MDNKNTDYKKPAAGGVSGELEESIDSVPMYRKKRVYVPVLIFLVVAVMGVLYLYFSLKRVVSTDDAYVDADHVTISSKYTGRIAELLADEGSAVQKGQVLARLDDSDLHAQEEQARSALTYAVQNQALAKVNMEKAEEDLDRATVQFNGNIIPKEQFDHAKKAAEAARAQNDIAAAQIGTARAQLGVIRTQLENIIITAPMDGMVAKKWAMPGDVVQIAQPILTIYQVKRLWITANLEETKYSRLSLGQKAEFTLDSFRGRKFRGRVMQLGSNTASEFSLIPPNNASGNFTKVTQRIPVKISIDSDTASGLMLLPGMSAELEIKVE